MLHCVLSSVLGNDDIKMKSLIVILKELKEPGRNMGSVRDAQVTKVHRERYLTAANRIKEGILEDSNVREP